MRCYEEEEELMRFIVITQRLRYASQAYLIVGRKKRVASFDCYELSIARALFNLSSCLLAL